MSLSRHLVLALPFIAIGASAQPAADLEKSVVGAWATSIGTHIEQVVQFKADHSFAMYPKCGRETEELKKRGLTVFPATWQLLDGDKLRLTMTFNGQTHSVDSTVAIVDGDLRMTTEGQVTVNHPYAGPLPPTCPAKR